LIEVMEIEAHLQFQLPPISQTPHQDSSFPPEDYYDSILCESIPCPTSNFCPLPSHKPPRGVTQQNGGTDKVNLRPPVMMRCP
jgi:hypothetical protein